MLTSEDLSFRFRGSSQGIQTGALTTLFTGRYYPDQESLFFENGTIENQKRKWFIESNTNNKYQYQLRSLNMMLYHFINPTRNG
jgi:hypothetical protein